jgi:putative ABC transport system substrate-binding protein
MTTRRELLIALGALAALPALAQQDKRVRRIGWIAAGRAGDNAEWSAAFRQGMAELKWVEGRDYVIDVRYANGVSQAIPGLADEMVASQPDLLLAPGDAMVRMLMQRTKTIPIVFAISVDPMGNGLVASLQRPGGNATGMTNLLRELGPKRLQLLKETFPRVVHVAVLYEPADAASADQAKTVEAAAKQLGMRVTLIELRQAADIEPAFRRGAAVGAQAYMPVASGLVVIQRQAIVDHVFRSKAPAIYATDASPILGGLMSYGPSIPDNFRRAAGFVDQILKGAKAGDLPTQQPTKFELVVNLKTAKTLGLTIPPIVLMRATRVVK